MIGDLNFDSSATNDLTRYLSMLEFTQMVRRATHLDGHILDQVFVSQSAKELFEIAHHFAYYSDHDGIIVNLKNNSTV